MSIPPAAGLAYTAAAPSQGGFDGATGRWEVGDARPRRVRVAAAVGTRRRRGHAHEIAAQVAATSIPDRAGEDDRAAVVIAVPGGAGGGKALKALPAWPRREGGPLAAQGQGEAADGQRRAEAPEGAAAAAVRGPGAGARARGQARRGLDPGSAAPERGRVPLLGGPAAQGLEAPRREGRDGDGPLPGHRPAARRGPGARRRSGSAKPLGGVRLSLGGRPAVRASRGRRRPRRPGGRRASSARRRGRRRGAP